MIEAAMIWNEPNNKSHWDLENDPGWAAFARLARLAGDAIGRAAPGLTRVLGGMSPIDPDFVRVLAAQGVLDRVDAMAVHGFPLDWNHWLIHDWPEKIAAIRAVTEKPVWVSEVGVSTFGAEEVQDWGLRRTHELLPGLVERIHWYSLFDLPAAWPATTRHREAEGSSYFRHFHMGLIDEHGRPKIALERFRTCTPEMGVCQWFHFEDPRLETGVRWLRELGVRHVRTGISWADWKRPGGPEWYDRMVAGLDGFDVTATFCFTPEDEGVLPHHTSPPREPERFAEFCAEMVTRYAQPRRAAAA